MMHIEHMLPGWVVQLPCSHPIVMMRLLPLTQMTLFIVHLHINVRCRRRPCKQRGSTNEGKYHDDDDENDHDKDNDKLLAVLRGESQA